MRKRATEASALQIPEEVAVHFTNPDQAERLDASISKVLSVARSELLRREAEYKKALAGECEEARAEAIRTNGI